MSLLQHIEDEILELEDHELRRIKIIVDNAVARLDTHQEDCGCGKCSGEDHAIEAMERGICEAERDYGDD